MHSRFCLPLVTLLWLASMAGQAAAADVFDLPLEALVKIPVQVATGTPVAGQQVPGAISVITAADLAATGAESLDEALERVPGLQVSHSGLIMAPRYFIRGIASTNNPQTLVLVNGLPMTSVWQGDRGPAWRGVPVSMIERVEIIRGPGSAVYGADAFAGVINIITRGPDDLHESEASISHGSFDTTIAALDQPLRLGAMRGVLLLGWEHTRGFAGVVDSDAQSSIDSLGLGPPASLAPGPVNVGFRVVDARSDLVWRQWRLRTDWQQVWNLGTGAGVDNALDPRGRFGSRIGDVDLLWDRPQWRPGWELSARLGYGYKSFNPESNIYFFPPGAFGGSFPDGVIDNPALAEQNLRFEAASVYDGWTSHRLRAGLGLYQGDLFFTDEQQNYTISSSQPVPTPNPDGLRDVSDSALLFQPTGRRSDGYGFVQDEWSLAPAWQLTTGLRHDQYSDFGGTTNPRLGLVWSTTPTLTTKLLYGEAFRAPSFAELYVNSNPVNLGNPGLKPEKLKSAELDFSWRPTPRLTADLSLYTLHIRDFITYVPDAGGSTFTAQNVGRVYGEGVELESRYQPLPALLLSLSASRQHTVDSDDNQPLGLAPVAKASFVASWSPASRWQTTLAVNAVGERPRQQGDPRPGLGGYTSCDLTLRRLHLPGDSAVAFSVKNIFDTRVREPSAGPAPGETAPAIPGDLPEPGRALTLSASTRW